MREDALHIGWQVARHELVVERDVRPFRLDPERALFPEALGLDDARRARCWRHRGAMLREQLLERPGMTAFGTLELSERHDVAERPRDGIVS